MSSDSSQYNSYISKFGIQWDSVKEDKNTLETNLTQLIDKEIGNTAYSNYTPGGVSAGSMSPLNSYTISYDRVLPFAPNHKTVVPEWFYNPVFGQGRGSNIQNLRAWARLEQVKIVTNKIIQRISRLDWSIVIKHHYLDKLKNETGKIVNNLEYKKLESKRLEIENFLKCCNGRHENISEINKQVHKDILELDAGVYTKVFNYRGELAEILSVDGGSIIKNFDIHGMPPKEDTVIKTDEGYKRIPAYYQYSLANPTCSPIPLFDEEITYVMSDPSSYSLYGTSKVEILRDRTLKYLFRSTQWNADFFEKNMIPSAIVSTQGMNDNQRKRAMQFWNSKVKGSDHKVQFIEGNLEVKQFQLTNKDMDFIEGSKYFQSLVSQIYGLNLNSTGHTDSVGGKNVAVDQTEQMNIDAIQPLIELTERAITTEIVPCFTTKPTIDLEGNKTTIITVEDIRNCPFEFKYNVNDTAEEQRKFNNLMVELGYGVLTRDEYREMVGRTPLNNNEQPTNDTQPGTDNDNNNNPDPNDNKVEDKDKNNKSVTKNVTDDKVEKEINRILKPFEKDYKKVYSDLDKNNRTDVEDLLLGYSPEYIANNLGKVSSEIESRLDSNSIAAKTIVTGLIASLFVRGYDYVESTADRLGHNINIPYTIQSNNIKDNLVVTNVDLINNVSDTQRKDIIQTLNNGINNNESIPQITKKIRSVIDTSSRAETIARTEVLRTFGLAQDQAAKDSSLFQYKKWITASDERVRCTHSPMNGQVTKIDDYFKLPACGNVPAEQMLVPRTGSAANSINCRCVVNYYITYDDAIKG